MFLPFDSESQGAIFRAIPFREPEIAGPLILLQVGDLNDIGDGVAIGGNVRLIDFAQGGPVFRFQGRAADRPARKWPLAERPDRKWSGG